MRDPTVLDEGDDDLDDHYTIVRRTNDRDNSLLPKKERKSIVSPNRASADWTAQNREPQNAVKG